MNKIGKSPPHLGTVTACFTPIERTSTVESVCVRTTNSVFRPSISAEGLRGYIDWITFRNDECRAHQPCHCDFHFIGASNSVSVRVKAL